MKLRYHSDQQHFNQSLACGMQNDNPQGIDARNFHTQNIGFFAEHRHSNQIACVAPGKKADAKEAWGSDDGIPVAFKEEDAGSGTEERPHGERGRKDDAANEGAKMMSWMGTFRLLCANVLD
ncbi:Os10g0330675 [Oryza sativa Japonica Group]|uniref:Os10g0330675 protein n=1 Tax=Oryza sativa subsp. japonica TaxID=39947 RepID=A0A0P0XTL4_ORYSJ|nr:Os10g0330675 [Oryza sativa Japonica Group]